MDLDKARELVEKHKDCFEKIASEGKFDETVRKIVSKSYFVMLIIKTMFIGTVWWFLSKLDPTCGTFFLLGLAMVQAKFLLDRQFDGFAENIIEAAMELEIGEEEKENADNESSERSGDGCNLVEDKEAKASEDGDSDKAEV
jgi:hypothetical protein